jgi:large subunit ribosomal protein L21
MPKETKKTTKKPAAKKTTKKTVAKKPAAKTKTSAKKFDLAVIETGGKQYLVKPGDQIKVEKLKKPARGTAVNFDQVLLFVSGKEIKIGTPYIKGLKIKATWLKEEKGKKITIVRYKSKTRRSKKKGHRQTYTVVSIDGF